MAGNRQPNKIKIDPGSKISWGSDVPYMVPRSLLDNTKLSWKAKGVAAYIIAKEGANGKEIIAAGLDGMDAVYSAIRELQDAGLIEKRVTRDNKGRVIAGAFVWKEDWR